MKSYLKIILPVVLMFLFAGVQAQKKKVTAKKTTVSNNTVVIKMPQRSFGSPASVSEITDITVADAAYESLKNLIENYAVTITYSDNTFRGKEILKRGDFVVAFNSALNNL